MQKLLIFVAIILLVVAAGVGFAMSSVVMSWIAGFPPAVVAALV